MSIKTRIVFAFASLGYSDHPRYEEVARIREVNFVGIVGIIQSEIHTRIKRFDRNNDFAVSSAYKRRSVHRILDARSSARIVVYYKIAVCDVRALLIGVDFGALGFGQGFTPCPKRF